MLLIYPRLQFSIFHIDLPDVQTWTSGQGELLYTDVTFRRSGIEVYLKYDQKIGWSAALFVYFLLLLVKSKSRRMDAL
jgi:hypothetical protein